ncbi:MAG TPA: phage terminase large subunit [Candidatus Omnitrophota bacterium]|nr:phage terminase large subunit [Candidatus Omnitrophota bacterium]
MNNDLFNEASRLRRAQGEKSLYAFAKIYMPHHIMIEPSAAHQKLYELSMQMFEKRGNKLAVAAFREFGKSTMFTVIVVTYAICYHKEEFIMLLSNSSSQSCQILENVKMELTSNELFRTDFPEVFESDGMPKPPRWKEGDIITRNNIQVLALGYNQKVRGRRFGANRPSLVILDDIEDGEMVFTRDKREKLKKWLNKVVLNAGQSGWTNYIFLGNVFNSFSLLGELVKEGNDSGWHIEHFKAVLEWPKNMDLWQKCWSIYCNGDSSLGLNAEEAAGAFYSLHKERMDEGAVLQWPQRWSLFELMMRYFFDEGGFLAEMQSEPKDLSDLSWDESSIHFWNDRYKTSNEILENAGRELELFGAADLSLGKSMVKGDYSSIVIVARKKGVYYIIEADTSRRRSERLQEDIFAYCERYKFRKFGIESNAFQEVFVEKLQRDAVARGIRTEFVPIHNSCDKLSRIQTLYPWIKNGSILFNKQQRLLLDECRSFPGGKHDDALDALEMAIRLASRSCNCPQLDEVKQAIIKLIARKMRKEGKIRSIDGDLKDIMRGWDEGLGGVFAKL